MVTVCPSQFATRRTLFHVLVGCGLLMLKVSRLKLQATTNQNVKKRPACSELRWAYCNHKATYFASYLTGGDSVPLWLQYAHRSLSCVYGTAIVIQYPLGHVFCKIFNLQQLLSRIPQ